MPNFAIVGFIYSQACPLACNFCCHTKDVVGPGKLTPDTVAPVVEEFAKSSSVIRFAFSGGDPFLYVNDIKEIMRRARRGGVSQPFHVVTSGYWADDDLSCHRQLKELHDLGMDMLDVSYDVEHARFVPDSYIYRIASCAAELGIQLEIFGNFWNQDERVADLLPNLDAVPMHSALVMPIGAARQHFNGPRYNLSDQAKFSCGRPALYDIAIYPNGTAFPCCSGGFNKEAHLELGNIFKDSPAMILERAFEFFHVRIAKEIGFGALYEKIKEKRPDLWSRLTHFKEVNSVCEICRDLHRTPDLMRELKPIYQEMEIDYALQKLDREWSILSQAVQVKSHDNIERSGP